VGYDEDEEAYYFLHAKKIRLTSKQSENSSKVVPVHSDCLKQIERYVENSPTADKVNTITSEHAPDGLVARKGSGIIYECVSTLEERKSANLPDQQMLPH